MAGTTSKWIRCLSGTLVSLDRIKCILVDEILDGTEIRAEVRAYMSEDFECAPYFVLFSHEDRAVCEEWRDTFAQEHLDILPRVVLWRKCPECNGTGRMPGPDPESKEPCPLCNGAKAVTLEEYESAMREWGLTP